MVAGILSLVIPSIADWAAQGPFLTLTLQRKLEGLRKSLAFMQELTSKVEQAASASAARSSETAEKVVVNNHSLLGQLASTTPIVILQIAYAAALAFMLLAHRNGHRRQIPRIPASFETRVRLARMREKYERESREGGRGEACRDAVGLSGRRRPSRCASSMKASTAA